MPDGHVSDEFIFASLSAWIVKPHQKSLKDTAQEITQSLNMSASFSDLTQEWFANCYSDLFDNNKIQPDISLDSWNKTFPPQGRQDIALPIQILEKIHVNPLEATLFLAALTKASKQFKDLRMLLLALRNTEGESKGKVSIILSWYSGPDKWRAININRVNLSYNENEKETTLLVNKLFRDVPSILPSLDNPGVYIDKKNSKIMVLDFNNTVSHYYIRAL